MPVFVAGDFNARPSSTSIKEMMSAQFTDCFTLKKKQEGEAITWSRLKNSNNTNYPPFTKFYLGENAEVKKTVDYIFAINR